MLTRALRRPLLLAVVTATTIATAVVPITPAFAADPTKGNLVGHLTDSHGAPVAGAQVVAQLNGSEYGRVATDTAGAYSFADVPPGQYQVGFTVHSAGGHAAYTQWAHQATYWNAAMFTVGAGATVAVDEQLLPLGTVNGRLLNRDGSPASVYVTVYQPDTQASITTASTLFDGRFEFIAPAGAYKLSYLVNNQFTQWSGGQRSFESAGTVTVTEGQTLTVEEQALATGSIGGRFTNAGGTPAANSWVTIVDELNTYRSTTTDADGRYRVDGLPVGGQYTVSASGPRWVPQWVHHKLNADDADRFTVAEGQTTTVDESFLPTGTVRVTAHDEQSGAPIQRFCLWVRESTNYSGCTEDGTVVVDEMFAGSWHLMVNTNDGIHLDKDNVPVVITGGQTTQVDVGLAAGAAITATLTDRATGGPAQGCLQPVDVDKPLPSAGNYRWCTEEGSNTVRIGPLVPGTYQLIADPTADSLGLQWVGATGGTGSREAAQRITLTSGAVVAAPAVAFDTGGTIRGRYTDITTGAPIAGSCVSVITPARNMDGGDGCTTADDGSYTLTGIGPYAWAVGFAAPQYQWRWSGNAVNRHEASTVTVVAGKKVTANLKARSGGGTVVGTIRDTAGAPTQAYLQVVDALTGEPVAFAANVGPDATYTIANVPPQQVKLYYMTGDGRAGWLGGTDLATAQTFRIRNDRTTTIAVTIPVS